ncbi:hypothetical protein O6H91_02G085300 [Diphasiastrum complanatum]|uniref:Uncharacterized protein n=1 Tax=Diphasiastrum complanatum TaxID=34168 RepID=A0ACC2EHP6_DIPCM|nr:hypothetical protein O6H91_02G085300 [Diphasiastrum complanatum]
MVHLRGLASVDYRGLASFCREFKNHCRMTNSLTPSDQSAINSPQCKHSQSPHNYHHKTKKSSSPSCPSLCEQSTAAVIDILVFFLVLGSCGVLLTPYVKYACKGASELLPATFLYIGEIVYEAPVAYVSGVLLTFVSVIGAWEIYQHNSRKCRNPHCKGLRKAVEFDIQLETEECIKLQNPSELLPWNRGVELTQDQKELEGELKRMAPPNGRAVLIYRAPCGCPAARFEVWAPKKARRAKK